MRMCAAGRDGQDMVGAGPTAAQAHHLRRLRGCRRCARPRRRAGLVDGRRIASRGLSAGGLLQGAVYSQRPDRWRAVVAEVPFVDVVTAMSDPSIPLTVNGVGQNGATRVSPQFMEYMVGYSPYDNPPPASAAAAVGDRCTARSPGAGQGNRRSGCPWLRATDLALGAGRTRIPPQRARCCSASRPGRVPTGARRVGSGILDYEAEVAAWILAALT